MPLLGACPLCAGASDAATGVAHADGHARQCWDAGARLAGETVRADCSSGERAVLCVYDRGDIREMRRADWADGDASEADEEDGIEEEAGDAIEDASENAITDADTAFGASTKK